MHPLITKLKRELEKAGPAGAAALARKVLANVAALGRGRAALRRCSRVGRRARCFGAPHVQNGGQIEIGDDFAASSAFGPVLLACASGGDVRIGNDVTVNYGTVISARSSVRIGHGVKVGPHCVIADTDVPLPLDDVCVPKPIDIGDGSWLAARVVVRPGVVIGRNAIVAAGSVVEADVPPNAIVSGAPARVLRIRAAKGEA